MVDSVDSGSGIPSTTPMTGNPETMTGFIEAGSGVGLGYSSEDSVSYSAEDAAEPQTPDSSVELDSPAASTTDNRDYLQRAFDTRLSGFRAIVADFNARFNADEVDLIDTQTLLMVIKGMVSDARALLSAETIGLSSGSQSLLQQRRLTATREQQQLKAEINDRYSQMNDANQQITNNYQTLTEKNASRLAKQQAIANATGSGDTALVAQLQSELTEINTAITQLIQDSATLATTIHGLQAANATSRAHLSLARQVIALVSEDFVNVRQLLSRVRERYDSAATETGEEEISESKRENRANEFQLNKNEQRLRESRSRMKEADGDVHDDQSATVERQTAETRFGPLPGIIRPAQVQALATLFPPEDPVILLQKLRDSSGQLSQPSPQELSEVSEALGLILQATVPRPTPDVTAREVSPKEQPHLGDNLSLEGADDPQAFTLLLLQKNMEALKDNVGDQKQLAALEMLQNVQIENLLNEIHQVETMVAEALEESEKTGAVIRRNPV